jgi:hypothetical protein
LTSKPLLQFPTGKRVNPQWRRKERFVTAIFGLKGHPGILLAADSEETVSGYSKRYAEKIGHWQNKHFRFAIGAAGASHYADLLAGKVSVRLNELKSFSLPTIAKTLENTLVEFHQRHIWSRPTTESIEEAAVQMIVVVQRTPAIEGQINVFGWTTRETAVNSLDGVPGSAMNQNARNCACIGLGGHLAEYIVERYNLGNEAQMVMMALFLMRELSRCIADVGRKPHMTLFRDDGTTDFFWTLDPEKFEPIFEQYDRLQMHLSSLVMDCRTPGGVNTSEEFLAEHLAEARAKAEALWADKLETDRMLSDPNWAQEKNG